jgi:putative redox protein
MAIIATTLTDSDHGYAQTISAGGFPLAADEPIAGGGTNTGPSPYALLLAALGACTSITLRMYAQNKQWELGHIHVELRHIKTHEGDQIERDLRFSAPLTDPQRAKLAEIAEKTPVTRTIKAGATIHTRLIS